MAQTCCRQVLIQFLVRNNHGGTGKYLLHRQASCGLSTHSDHLHSIILNVIAPILNGFIAWLCGYHQGSFPAWKIIFLAIGAFSSLWAGVTLLFLYVP